MDKATRCCSLSVRTQRQVASGRDRKHTPSFIQTRESFCKEELRVLREVSTHTNTNKVVKTFILPQPCPSIPGTISIIISLYVQFNITVVYTNEYLILHESGHCKLFLCSRASFLPRQLTTTVVLEHQLTRECHRVTLWTFQLESVPKRDTGDNSPTCTLIMNRQGVHVPLGPSGSTALSRG